MDDDIVEYVPCEPLTKKSERFLIKIFAHHLTTYRSISFSRSSMVITFNINIGTNKRCTLYGNTRTHSILHSSPKMRYNVMSFFLNNT